jgi:hypothetical protein
MDDRAEMKFLGREKREGFPQVEPRLGAEKRNRAGTGAIAPRFSLFENEAEQIVVLTHELMLRNAQKRALCDPEIWFPRGGTLI